MDPKDILRVLVPHEQKRVTEFRKKCGNIKVGEINVEMLYTGMRGMKGMVYETSLLDAEEGIRFRGYSIPELQQLLPKAPGGSEPLPEGLFFLMLTGMIPTAEQVQYISREWAKRASLPGHTAQMLAQMPRQLHPMSQFVAAIASMQSESRFSAEYQTGKLKKIQYWEMIYEDAMNLLAKLPTVAATIYRNLYKERTPVGSISSERDWSANFVEMLGMGDNKEFIDCMRLYLTIHADHEGGNVSAHTLHLVGSALSDPYLSLAAGMCGLAGPLHGLANQEVLIFYQRLLKELGPSPTNDQVADFVQKLMAGGQVVPGFGHAVLRKTDPRYICQREFSLKCFPNDPLFKLCSQVYEVVPPILSKVGKIKNPWPNVDAHSGVLLQHYGMKEMAYYTVMFGVSRALGTLAQNVWSRALGFPIERPKSLTTEALEALVTKENPHLLLNE